MSKFLNLGLEEAGEEGLADPEGKPDELEKADQMVQGEESTDPATVVKIANYKEELAALKEQQGTNDDSGDSGEDTGSNDDQGGTEEAAEGEDGDSDAEDSSAEEEGDETDGEGDVEPATDKKTEEEGDGEGLSSEDAEQLTEAVESFAVLKKFHTLVNKAGERNSLTKPAVEVINISMEHIKTKLGLQGRPSYQIPAMENLASFTTRHKYTASLNAALEGIIGDVWAGIVRMFKAIWDWIADFLFNKKKTVKGARDDLKATSSAAANLSKGLEKKKSMEQKSGSEATGVPFNNKRGYLLITPGLDVSDSKSLSASMNTLIKNAIDQQTKLFNFTAKLSDLIKSILDAQTPEQVSANDDLLRLDKLFDFSGMTDKADIKNLDLKAYKAKVTPQLPFDSYFFVKYLETAATAQDYHHLAPAQTYDVAIEDNSNVDQKLNLIDNVDAVKVVTSFLESLVKHREQTTKNLAVIHKALGVINTNIKNYESYNDAMTVEIVRQLKTTVMLFSNIGLRGNSKVDKLVDAYRLLLIDYLNQSNKEFGLK